MKVWKAIMCHWWEVLRLSRLLRADFYRMYGKKCFWMFAGAMAAAAMMFIGMQYTAMDYQVGLDRVIFLPMSFYGVIVSAMISLFIGDDFSDGVIRNKLIAGRRKKEVYLSNFIVTQTACAAVYVGMTAMTVGIGIHLFENNVSVNEFLVYFLLGLLTCLAFGSIFCMLSMLIGNKSTAVMVSMGIAFFMLFLCLHTNQVLVQTEYKNGVLNPHFISGIRRIVYELSAMNYLNPIRWIFCDMFWIVIGVGVGSFLFERKDIK